MEATPDVDELVPGLRNHAVGGSCGPIPCLLVAMPRCLRTRLRALDLNGRDGRADVWRPSQPCESVELASRVEPRADISSGPLASALLATISPRLRANALDLKLISR